MPCAKAHPCVSIDVVSEAGPVPSPENGKPKRCSSSSCVDVLTWMLLELAAGKCRFPPTPVGKVMCIPPNGCVAPVDFYAIILAVAIPTLCLKDLVPPPQPTMGHNTPHRECRFRRNLSRIDRFASLYYCILAYFFLWVNAPLAFIRLRWELALDILLLWVKVYLRPILALTFNLFLRHRRQAIAALSRLGRPCICIEDAC